MIIIMPNVYDGQEHAMSLNAIPDHLLRKSEFVVCRGMVIKNRRGRTCHVFEPSIEENENEFVIRIPKDKE